LALGNYVIQVNEPNCFVSKKSSHYSDFLKKIKINYLSFLLKMALSKLIARHINYHSDFTRIAVFVLAFWQAQYCDLPQVFGNKVYNMNG
jgi:hypothetical protein